MQMQPDPQIVKQTLEKIWNTKGCICANHFLVWKISKSGATYGYMHSQIEGYTIYYSFGKLAYHPPKPRIKRK